MIVSVAAAALPMTEGQVSRRPSHADDDIPARRRLRVLREIAHDVNAEMPGCLEAERRRRAGQRQDRYRLSWARARRGCARRRPINVAGREYAVSSPPIVTSALMPMSLSTFSTFFICASDLVGLVREVPRIEPPRKCTPLTSSMCSTRCRSEMPCASHLKPSRKPDHFEVVIDRLNRHRADHAIDSRRRTAAHQYRQPAVGCSFAIRLLESRPKSPAFSRKFQYFGI